MHRKKSIAKQDRIGRVQPFNKIKDFGSSSRTIDHILSCVLGAVLQVLKPPWRRGEEVQCVLPTSMKTPDRLEPEGGWC